MASKIIVSTLTRVATYNVYLDHDHSKPTGFYRNGDSILVRTYATGPTFTNTFVDSQEFKITPTGISSKYELSEFVIPENTTKLTAFCVYGSRLDDGYPDMLDPEFCTDIDVEWKVEHVVPEITMDQWAYFNTKSITDRSSTVLPAYTIPTTITGTTTSIVPFDVKFSVTKDPNIYGSNNIPLLNVATITPNQDGTWELPLSTVVPPTTNTILNFLTQNQYATITFVYNSEVIHTQNIYYPRISLDSAHTSMPQAVATVFDIGGFNDKQPCMVINIEQDYALIARYTERQTTSKYTMVEYSTDTDSVLIGPNMESYSDSYDKWRGIVKNKTYYQDGQPTDYGDYAFKINGVLTGPNSLAIKRKYKFIHPSENISIELEMLFGKFGSIVDNCVDSFYNKTLAINNKIVTNGIFDINDVSPTTGDYADYYVSVLSSTNRDVSLSYETQFVGSTSLGTTIFKPNSVFQRTVMNGVAYTGNGYQWSNASSTDISIGRFPVGTNKVICAVPLNRGIEFTSDLKYVISKGYAEVENAPSDIYGVLVVGTPSLGTINAIPAVQEPVYTPGKMNQLSLRTMHLMGVSSNPADTIVQVGAWSYGWETTIEPTINGWGDIKEVAGDASFVAALTNSGLVKLAWTTNSNTVNTWINNYIISATTWTNIEHIAVNNSGIVGLKTDGTVMLASAKAGLSVSSWTDIVQVKANGVIVGLKSNGTVVYTGTARNYANNANVDFSEVLTWTDITQIDVGPNYIVGVKSNGTVVITGETRNGISQCQNWTGIITIAAGDFHVVGGKSNGTVVAVGGYGAIGELNVGSWTGVRRVYAGIQWSAGVKYDGTVVSTFDTTLLNNAGYDPNYTNVNSWKVPL